MPTFDGVVATLDAALTKRGYTQLTPVQQEVLAPELAAADVLVSAQTGSGKTVAFGLAIAPTLLDGADRLGRADTPIGLVVAPTRELALQVKRELEWLYEEAGASIASCVGGMDMRTERRALDQGAHIVVGTPGRLRDHIERGSFDTSALRAVVLDEADEMLDLGFREDLEYILDAAPVDRRTLMFSATVSRPIAALAKRYQRDAVRVSTTAEQSQHVDIEYRALGVAPNDRENAIINVLRYYDAKNTIVFCATRAMVNHMTSRFNNRGFSVVALSGELSQNERSHALQAMRDGRARVCIATDVAARGIDLPNLDLVVHADLPKTSEGLLHRSGRTGRAGRKGVSAVIVPHNARRHAERLFRNAKIEAEWAAPPSLEEVAKRDRERILADPTLSGDMNETEQAFAQDLLAKYSPEQVAVAFLRQHQAKTPAPEELIDAAPAESRPRARDDFKDGVWFSLSVGHKHTAEPRWLLPMLCRAGHITKNDIGAIRIYNNETHVELAPGCVDRFLEAIGPSRKVEKSVTLTRLQGEPKAPEDQDEKKYAKKTPFGARKGAAGGGDGKRPYKPRDDARDGAKKPYKPREGARDEAKKPYRRKDDDFAAKPDRKRTFDGPAEGRGGPKKPYKSKDKDGDRNRGEGAGWAKRSDGFKSSADARDPSKKPGGRKFVKGKKAKPGKASGGPAKGDKPGSAPLSRRNVLKLKK